MEPGSMSSRRGWPTAISTDPTSTSGTGDTRASSISARSGAPIGYTTWHTSTCMMGNDCRERFFPSYCCHGDLWYENVLMDDACRTVTGIVDFEAANVGDPAQDFNAAPSRKSGYRRR